METSFLIAGFGGQGVMLIGKMLGYAAVCGGRNAAFYPSYGPEQRGGTANCTVVLADGGAVGSPVVREADVVAVMNEPSLEKFEDRVKPGGALIINRSLAAPRPVRADVKTVWIPANEMAAAAGAAKAANMVVLGQCVAISRAVTLEMAIAAITARMRQDAAARAQNILALRVGAAFDGTAPPAGRGVRQR